MISSRSAAQAGGRLILLKLEVQHTFCSHTIPMTSVVQAYRSDMGSHLWSPKLGIWLKMRTAVGPFSSVSSLRLTRAIDGQGIDSPVNYSASEEILGQVSVGKWRSMPNVPFEAAQSLRRGDDAPVARMCASEGQDLCVEPEAVSISIETSLLFGSNSKIFGGPCLSIKKCGGSNQYQGKFKNLTRNKATVFELANPNGEIHFSTSKSIARSVVSSCTVTLGFSAINWCITAALLHKSV